ncbi:hypothetical protein SK128_011891 [Halocaridina rubra]|uniref:Peroxisomal leader peptide-processing protease n=1 Tax=Halocaridina rubra TaxID=373956 RepID=A0AAN8X679_HALRR
MGGLGVIVESSISSVEEKENDKLSCSGIYVSNGWILTHGTIVIDVLRDENAGPLLKELKTKGYAFHEEHSPLHQLMKNTSTTLNVLVDEKNHGNITSNISQDHSFFENTFDQNNIRVSKPFQLKEFSHQKREQSVLQLPPVSSKTTGFYCHPAKVFMLFIQPDVMRTVSAMMPASEGWRLSEEKEGETTDSELEVLTVSTFALLKTSHQRNDISQLKSTDYIKELNYLLSKIIPFTGDAIKGSNVFIESTPFGSLSPRVFLNSLSKGIISNVSGFGKDIYLTDARCIMGAEGAPVYLSTDDMIKLCGIVISPFCWKQGEWLGLSLLAAIRPLLKSLILSVRNNSVIESNEMRALTTDIEFLEKPVFTSRNISKNAHREGFGSAYGDIRFEGIAEMLNKVVVGISCGSGWGSGIVINSSPGIILTCAHVIQPSVNGDVTIITSDGNRVPGCVIYHTYPSCFSEGKQEDGKSGISFWDLAVVCTKTTLPHVLPLASQLPPVGSSVVVAGHGIFSPNCLPSPTLVHGVISKVVNVEVTCLNHTLVSGNICDPFSDVNSQQKADYCDIDVENDAYFEYKKADVLSNLSAVDARKVVPVQCSEKGKTVTQSDCYGRDEDGFVPVMLQTTCSVYAGNSGGPVVYCHPAYGPQAVGVMICNTKDLANKATFPNINLAVPSLAINNIINAFLSTGDKEVLKPLGVECERALQLWALGRTPQAQL